MPFYTDLARFQTMISLFIFFIIVGVIRYLIRNNIGKKIFDIILLFFILGWNGIVWEVFYQGGPYVFFAMGYSIFTVSILLYLIISRKRVYPKRTGPIIPQEFSDISLTDIRLDNEIEQPVTLEVDNAQSNKELTEPTPFLCPTCKKSIPNDSQFCIYCGCRIKDYLD